MSPGRDGSAVELACFEVHGQRYGIDVHQIREIVRNQEATPLPGSAGSAAAGSPGLIEGVIDLRGAIVPVVDLGRALAGRPVAASARARIAIVEVENLVFGLRVDAAADVVAVAAADVGDPPPLVTHAGYETVRAVVRRAGARPTLVLSLEHLLECIYRAALDAAGAAPGARGEAPGVEVLREGVAPDGSEGTPG